jgi:hypothetical protein
MMNRLIRALLVASLIPAATFADDQDKLEKTGELKDPVAILKKADAATGAMKAVRYDVTIEGTGVFEPRGKFEATITAAGALREGSGRYAPEKYLADGKVTLPGAEEPLKISGGTDGDTYFVIHHATKTAYEDIDPTVMGNSGQVFATGFMIEFLIPKPFNDEITGKKQELTGSKQIAGEDCYEVHVVYTAERAPEAIWYFSKEDFRPRRRVDVVKLQDGREGTIVKTITKLVANPKLEPDAFKLKLPQGYTKTDDFAPDLTP